ncbi:unnamed protein product [Acanthoscelides obtectus]|uniref:Uncharacterized protein n=1 Tax=Acanthoscelides obtectus TaxID=200917 RepID=A0A9P0K1G5_ACAOB|nr:unnamed protein product [Acanthoscelides obtectus]CAK1647097.1 hypothetical protein AOBTE_LOCUS15042 [Acanthoscelides obtectus]
MSSPSRFVLVLVNLSLQFILAIGINNGSYNHYKGFDTAWSWSYVNYTWPSAEAYWTALATLRNNFFFVSQEEWLGSLISLV